MGVLEAEVGIPERQVVQGKQAKEMLGATEVFLLLGAGAVQEHRGILDPPGERVETACLSE
jgi:hypothetical protein